MSEHEKKQDEHGRDHGERGHASHAKDFIDSFKDFRVRRRLAARVRAIPEGDWEALCALAAAEGHPCSVDELKRAMPQSFYKGEGKSSDRFWSRES